MIATSLQAREVQRVWLWAGREGYNKHDQSDEIKLMSEECLALVWSGHLKLGTISLQLYHQMAIKYKAGLSHRKPTTEMRWRLHYWISMAAFNFGLVIEQPGQSQARSDYSLAWDWLLSEKLCAIQSKYPPLWEPGHCWLKTKYNSSARSDPAILDQILSGDQRDILSSWRPWTSSVLLLAGLTLHLSTSGPIVMSRQSAGEGEQEGGLKTQQFPQFPEWP